MPVLFPHANKYRIRDERFIATWRQWFERFGPVDSDWRADAMPRINRAVSLSTMLASGVRFGLDILCRFLVPWPYRNTMHATNPFLDTNAHLLERAYTVNPATGRRVNGVRLTSDALDRWASLGTGERDRLSAESLALLESDIEVGKDNAELVGQSTEEPAFPRPVRPSPSRVRISQTRWKTDREGFVRAFVEEIEKEPFQPMYRRKAVGEPVMGWADRLRAYFWPSPDTGYLATHAKIAPLLRTAQELAIGLEQNGGWSASEGARAVDLAEGIFRWGGVPQPTPRPDTVRNVFENALAARAIHLDAPMNSGWTKVTAFATAHLEGEPDRHTQTIWDSRVATSVTGRLDRLLSSVGIDETSGLFPSIGTVAGRGGTRPRELLLRWPVGYGRWSCQFAGSALVEQVRDMLNHEAMPDTGEPYTQMPLPDGGTGPWEVRGVEMVLFGDGY